MTDINRTLFSVNRAQEEKHTKEYALRMKMPYADLVGYPFASDVFEAIPFDQAILHKVIPFLKIGKTIKIGIVEPENTDTKNYLQTIAKSEAVTFSSNVISNTSLLFSLQAYEQVIKKKQEQHGQSGFETQENLSDKIKTLADVAKTAASVNTTRTFDVLLIGAVKNSASDIHLEPGESNYLVRYRIDGILQNVVRLPQAGYKSLLSRIKFLAKLKMDKMNEPQDGRFSVTVDKNRIDLRVATLPSAYGESVVLRLLGQDRSMQRLDNLGFRPDALAIIHQAISQPHGMILNTGPTGSGKSTTLYAIILEVRKPGLKIITLEDPIEYRIEGVEQSQIDPEGKYTFADGLRGCLRADPDIIMVGEIRDTETAQIGVQAALTGHLLLSTVHANSAPAVFPRLIDIGVKPFLLAGSVNLVMAQRLIRVNCQKCLEEYLPPDPIWQEVVKSMATVTNRIDAHLAQMLQGRPKLRRGRGCPACNNSGFVNRQAIIEVLRPDGAIEDLIAKQATQSTFMEASIKQDMITMEQDGLIKVLQGKTTIEEVWRVTKEG